jgi:hypothetical protein
MIERFMATDRAFIKARRGQAVQATFGPAEKGKRKSALGRAEMAARYAEEQRQRAEEERQCMETMSSGS